MHTVDSQPRVVHDQWEAAYALYFFKMGFKLRKLGFSNTLDTVDWWQSYFAGETQCLPLHFLIFLFYYLLLQLIALPYSCLGSRAMDPGFNWAAWQHNARATKAPTLGLQPWNEIWNIYEGVKHQRWQWVGVFLWGYNHEQSLPSAAWGNRRGVVLVWRRCRIRLGTYGFLPVLVVILLVTSEVFFQN